MSEYQYFEWLAIDRPLTKDQLREVNGLSSHMDEVTPTQAIVTYEWGDFKHDPIKVLAKFFDAFLYTTNWGTRRLAFRFPATALDNAAIKAYLIPNQIELKRASAYSLLTLDLDDEGGGGDMDWVDTDGLLGQIAVVRRQLMSGDFRALYITWLAQVALKGNAGNDDDDSDSDDSASAEPPIPPGMAQLDGSLTALCEFFAVPKYLVKAAATKSPKQPAPSAAELRAKLTKLPRERANDFLLRLLSDDSPLSAELRRELGLNQSTANAGKSQSRSQKSLLADAKSLAHAEAKQAQARAAKARIVELEKLATREDGAWLSVAAAIQNRTASAYDQAIKQLLDLRDLAQHRGNSPAFQVRLATLLEKLSPGRAFTNRLNKARLM